MNKLLTIRGFIFTLILAKFCVASYGESPKVDALDIVGLKLGMTFAEANAALVKYKPELTFLPTYLTEENQSPGNLNSWPDDGKQHRYKTQVGIVAYDLRMHFRWDSADDLNTAMGKFPVTDEDISAAKAYKDFWRDRTAQQRVRDLENKLSPQLEVEREPGGEMFRLCFTPNDTGGKLYAMIRARDYGPYTLGPDGKSNLPTLDSFTQQITGKYGKLVRSNPAQGEIDYDLIYDIRGRLLPATNPEFKRSNSDIFAQEFNFVVPTEFVVPANSRLSQLIDAADNGGNWNLSLHLYKAGSKMATDYQNNMAIGLTNSAPSFFPSSQNSFVSVVIDGTQYRGAGTHLAIRIWTVTDNVTHINYVRRFAVSVADQNALYYDNGAEKYIRAITDKIKAGAGTSASKEKF